MQTQYLTAKYKKLIEEGTSVWYTAQAYNAKGVAGPAIPVTDGTITYDYTAATRRTIQLAISDPTRALVPDLANDTLAPYGQKLKVWMSSAQLPNILMGHFYLDEIDADDAGTTFDFEIKGWDLSGKISQEALTAVYTIPSGEETGTAILALLNFVRPGMKFNFAPSKYVTPKTVLDVNQDPWAACVQLAQAASMDLFFDRNNVCVLRPYKDPTTIASSWKYSDDKKDGWGLMIDELTKTVVASNTVYNDVIVTGETTGTTDTYSGRAYDNNPGSKTYIHGPYGDVPVFFTSSIITSNAQAQELAEAKLTFFSGRASQITLLGPPNPAQDEEDVVRVNRVVDGVKDALFTTDKIAWALAAAGVNSTSGQNTGQQTQTLRAVIATS